LFFQKPFLNNTFSIINSTMVAKTASKRVSKETKQPVVSVKKDVPGKKKNVKETKPVKNKKDLPNKKEKKHVDEPLVNKAVTALLKHHEEQSKDSKALLGTDTTVQVQIGLEIAPMSPSPKPIRIMIPHPILKLDDKLDDTGLEEPEVCLIVKEESKEWVTEMIAQFPDHMGCIKKVLGLQSLRTKHAQFQQRRELMHKYTHFMADDRILPMLTKALGKSFMKAKKQPIPIALTRKEALPFAIHKALSATFMTLKEGTCVTIRAGNTGMPADKLMANITAITEHAIQKLPRKWANVRSIAIKTPESVSLPIYNKTPEELVEIGRMAGLKSVWKEPVKQTSTTEKEEEEELAAKDEKKRKVDKLAAKSPLVRALKKQKQKEEAPKVVPVEEVKETKKKVAAKETTPKKATKETTPKKAKAEVASARPTRSAVKKTRERSDAGEEAESPTKKSKKETIQDEPKASQKTEKRIKSSEVAEKKVEKEAKKVEKSPKKEPKKKAEKEVKKVESFIASKKYTGTRKGFVFRAGSDGVGYYKDVKPVVDKAALEAIARMGGRSKGTKSPKSGGKRRSR
jgi:ribosome biogenesis protein UTP30